LLHEHNEVKQLLCNFYSIMHEVFYFIIYFFLFLLSVINIWYFKWLFAFLPFWKNKTFGNRILGN
jgi:hypothetical protein